MKRVILALGIVALLVLAVAGFAVASETARQLDQFLSDEP